MILTIPKTVHQEIEIDASTPQFRKLYDNTYIKFYLEDGEIKVLKHVDGVFKCAIEIRNLQECDSHPLLGEGEWEKITEEEFKSALMERIKKYNVLQ